jgi:tetratricopeptide (TPR) repeat protein
MSQKDRRKKAQPKGLDIRVMGLALLAIPLLVVILYGGSLKAPFVYDDRVHIVENPLVSSFQSGVDVSAIRAVFEQPSGLAGRPLLLITYGLNYAQSGLSPEAFRKINLFIHTANAVLVFLIVWQLGASAGLPRPRQFWLAYLAAVLFVVHPLAAESVTYVTGRSSSLCAMFYFGGLYCTLLAGRLQTSNRWILLTVAVLCAAAGWMVKPEAVTLPAASIALIWFGWPRTTPNRARWIATAIQGSAILIILALQLKPIARVSESARSNEDLVAAGFEATLPYKPYFMTSVKEYSAYYLWRFALPLHQSVDPDSATVNTPFHPGFVLSVAVLLGLSVSVFWLQRRRPVAAAGVILILVSPLSAYCLFPLADIVAEHRAYITILGAAIVLADLLHSRAAVAISIAIVIAFAWLTIERNKTWNDELLLWQDASRQAPEKIRPHLNLGSLYQARGLTAEAVKEYETVLQRVPDHAASLSNLSSLYLAANDLNKAEQVLDRAAAQPNKLPAVYMNLAVLRMRQSRLVEARQLLHQVESLNPQQFLVHHNLGDIFLNEGKPEDAIREYLVEIARNPDFALTHLHLALAYEAAAMPEMAKREYRTVLTLEPGNSEAQTALGKLK